MVDICYSSLSLLQLKEPQEERISSSFDRRGAAPGGAAPLVLGGAPPAGGAHVLIHPFRARVGEIRRPRDISHVENRNLIVRIDEPVQLVTDGACSLGRADQPQRGKRTGPIGERLDVVVDRLVIPTRFAQVVVDLNRVSGHSHSKLPCFVIWGKRPGAGGSHSRLPIWILACGSRN